MQKIDFNEIASLFMHKIAQGAFLTTKHMQEKNTMTIGWGSIGFNWGLPTLTIMCRHSRYTYELLNNSDYFTVSIPLDNNYKQALAICGSKSGRDINKFQAADLTLLNGQIVPVPVIQGNFLHIECKTIYKQDMDLQQLAETIAQKWYNDNDVHKFFYGEILAAYKTN